jgi:hypothetical protein
LEDKTLWPTLGATGIIICFWISWIHLLNEKWKFNISFCFQIAIKQFFVICQLLKQMSDLTIARIY